MFNVIYIFYVKDTNQSIYTYLKVGRYNINLLILTFQSISFHIFTLKQCDYVRDRNSQYIKLVFIFLKL